MGVVGRRGVMADVEAASEGAPPPPPEGAAPAHDPPTTSTAPPSAGTADRTPDATTGLAPNTVTAMVRIKTIQLSHVFFYFCTVE